ncbi:MAG: VWA domain-containing protein [Acidobacteriota bacterium]
MKSVFYFYRAIALMVVGLLWAGLAIAQEQPAANQFKTSQPDNNSVAVPASDQVLEVKSELVLIDVSVQDKDRNFIAGLGRGNFRVFDEQVEQQIEIFSSDNVPVSFGIVIDTSGSMRFKLKTVISAAKELLGRCRPGDEVFIVDMKDPLRIRFVQPFTSNVSEAIAKLDNMYSSGGTALLDGISAAGQYADQQAKNRRRALVVMSDGDERDSSIKVSDMIDQLRELNVQVYMIGFPEGFVDSKGTFLESTAGKAKGLLKKVAEETGGQAFFPDSLDEVSIISGKINEGLRSQYILGYYPSNDKRDGRWHRLQVKLSDTKKKYAVRTRSGYFASK